MKKKSPQVSYDWLDSQFKEIEQFLDDALAANLSAGNLSKCYDYAIVQAYRIFESFVLDIAVARINRDPTIFFENVGVEFGKHLTVAQCAYLLVGDRYFNFSGHSGLVDVAKKVAGPTGALTDAVKIAAHRQHFEILAGLRNHAAHQSDQSRSNALKAMRHWEPGRTNLGIAGSWLKVSVAGRTRMTRLLDGIRALADDMRNAVT